MENPQYVIFDLGSHTIKSQLSNSENPYIIKTLCGKPKYQKVIYKDTEDFEKHNSKEKLIFYEQNAYINKGILKLSYPIQNGIVHNWEKFEKLLYTIYCDYLKIDFSANPAFVLNVPLCPEIQSEKIATFFFETLRVPSLFMTNTSYTSFLSQGKTTGIMLESGDGVSSSMAIIDGDQYKYTIQKNNIAGKIIIEYLRNLLKNQGIYLATTSEFEILREIKEKCCLVSPDFKASYENKLIPEMTYKLPDGKVIVLGKERFTASEVLFRPDIFGSEDIGLHKLIKKTVEKCEITILEDLRENIICGGGTMKFIGIQERLEKEIVSIFKKETKINIQENPIISSWKGAQILSQLSVMEKMCVSDKEYEENGVNIIKTKLLK